jgi:hypothetical protein
MHPATQVKRYLIHMKTKTYLPIIVATLLVSVTNLAVASDNNPPPAPTAAVVTERGWTSVRLDQNLIPTLQSLGISISPLAPSTVFYANAGIVSFPIDSGIFDAPNSAGEISHSGGLVLSAPSKQLVVSSFVIEVSSPSSGQSPILTGLATLNGELLGRIPLFDIDLSSAEITFPHWRLKIKNAGLSLNADAATALNSIFSTSAFNDGIAIGQAKVNAFTVQLPH